jgi:hypothetical protein
VHLVTFATEEFATARDALISSAMALGEFDQASSWDAERLADDPTFPGRPLLAYSRGVGFWSWKPHVILTTLASLEEGDVVVYSDAGRYDGGFTVRRSVTPLIDFAERHGGMLAGVSVPHFGPNSRWTKRDCFVLMGCDAPEYWTRPQVQASISVWIKSTRVLHFLEEWGGYCADPRVVGDGPNTCGLPNLPGFVDHRHDQSVLTNLVVKHQAVPFSISDRLFGLLVRMRRKTTAANVFCKKIDNISAIAEGRNGGALYLGSVITSARRRARGRR